MHNAASPESIPNTFCWSRIGAESGQDLDRILQRKELERAGNRGVFLWGVGNALGTAVRELVSQQGAPTVVFSPMRSAAADIDANPAGVTLWLDYVDAAGRAAALPAASIVTSRSETARGVLKRSHFALYCYSSAALELQRAGTINFGELRNLSTGRALGFSQVTAIVSRAEDFCSTRNAQYEASIVCRLAAPYFAKLCTGVQLKGDEMRAIETAASLNDPTMWGKFAGELKAALRQRATEAPTMYALAF